MHQIVISLLLLFSSINHASFEFTFDPIDVVIPCHKKDTRTLELAIKGARANIQNCGRIIVVSAEQYSTEAEWFDERNYPFTQETVAFEIFKDTQKAHQFMNHPKTRIGWIYQQLLKAYAIFVIPNISPNVLILDADTIFLRPISFQDHTTGAGLYNPGTENTIAYFQHLERVLPGCKKVFPQYSGISHHMLLQRSVMNALYADIRKAHNGKEPWIVFCEQIDHNELFKSCMCVEYELYFNYIFARDPRVQIRHCRWDNIPFYQFNSKKHHGYDYLSCHAWMDNP